MTDQNLTARAAWRKSSFSESPASGAGNCVEVAALGDGTVAVRDSKDPGAGVLRLTRAAMAAWVTGCKAGEFDHTATR